MNKENKEPDQCHPREWILYYLLLLVFGVSLGGGLPLLLVPWIHDLLRPERGITTHYPMEATIEVPDILDLARIEPKDLSTMIPNAYMLSFTRKSLYHETIRENLISQEIFLNGSRVSSDYGSYPNDWVLLPGRAGAFATPFPLENLSLGEHCLTVVLFQRYDPQMEPPPKATVVTKYFTVIDSSQEE